eukprot:CAMPEP_0118911674 /NCGR_PEP_ID=MMETSP1166-20130328/13267_1 /TAXON_ID=1104430 /ORGANISM="Chrysoreinhardia sp, Strain CCMP3193" /LENGTH=66 /DNA_ID=CAMNT_0006851171 /DNA_START=65 /DNA_END=265 /DNA_ORIENTATION=+
MSLLASQASTPGSRSSHMQPPLHSSYASNRALNAASLSAFFLARSSARVFFMSSFSLRAACFSLFL